MTDKDTQQTEKKKPGEKPAGEMHYNPGNMSGKKIGVKEEAEREAENERQKSREHQQKQRQG